MKKGDKIVLISLTATVVVVAIAFLGYQFFNRKSDKIAVIKVNGEIIKTINLKNQQQPENITTTFNGSYNVITYKKDEIHFIESDCPDKICINAGILKNHGDSAACLPHKTIITIEGEHSELDGTAN